MPSKVPSNIPQTIPELNSADQSNEIRCPVCEGSRLLFLYTSYDYNRETTKVPFKIYGCDTCGTGITVPQLRGAQLSLVYPKVYYNLNSYRNRDFKTSVMYKHQLEKVKLVKQVLSRGKLFDVGCGVGSFVLAAQENGYEAKGIEMSKDAVEFGKAIFFVDIFQGDILTYPLKVEVYDVVTLWHVFEHLPNPNEVLMKISSILKQGGLLVIAVPNFASIQARLFRSWWYHLDVPRHLYHYSADSLAKIVSCHGFLVEKIEHYSGEHNWGGYVGSLFDLHSLHKESLFHKISRKTYAAYLSHVLARIESVLKRGGTITLIARKLEEEKS